MPISANTQSDFIQRAFWIALAVLVIVGITLTFQARTQQREALRGKAAEEVFRNTLEFHPKVHDTMKELIACIKKEHYKITRYIDPIDIWRPRDVCPRYAQALEKQGALPMELHEIEVAHSYLISNLQKGL